MRQKEGCPGALPADHVTINEVKGFATARSNYRREDGAGLGKKASLKPKMGKKTQFTHRCREGGVPSEREKGCCVRFPGEIDKSREKAARCGKPTSVRKGWYGREYSAAREEKLRAGAAKKTNVLDRKPPISSQKKRKGGRGASAIQSSSLGLE